MFPINTILAWIINDYHEQGNIIITNLLLPLGHISNNWVIIKVLYRCHRRYLLGWPISRLGFVTPIVGEVSLGPLDNAQHLSLASIATNELVAG